MKNILNPKWLFLVNSLPLIILFSLLYSQYSIIKTLLHDEAINYWIIFGITLTILGFLNFLYTIYLIYRSKNISKWYSLFTFVAYIPFIYLYSGHINDLVPFNIPNWMITGNVFIYVGTFLMPTLAHSLFVLVVHFTNNQEKHKAWLNFLLSIGVPILGYLFTQILLPLRKLVDYRYREHVLVIIVIVFTLIFLFFLIRTLYILLTKKSTFWGKYQLGWKIPVTIILPLIGLGVNNGHLFYQFDNHGIFGDFNHPLFYIIALVNGILICLQSPKNPNKRLIIFVAKSITFAYTLYFFIVFLPFLPLSVVAILILGLGFLLLAPLLLFVLHVYSLFQDYNYLKSQFSKKLVISLSLIGLLILPEGLTLSYLNDKIQLNKALDYVYHPNYEINYDINKDSLKKTLNLVKENKDNKRFLFGQGIPYLSSYFNWLVLDNLTLSSSKINVIESVFFGASFKKVKPENIQNDEVKISNINTTSTYDKNQKIWKSSVDLEITNHSKNNRLGEYTTTISLPNGSWISDYYLYVGDQKEYGILAEKKSAMWIYSQIRNENRDPGILYYLTGNRVAFRVFPFAKEEIRKTGIELIHKEPITLNIDTHVLKLGNSNETLYENLETENIVYVSSKQKQTLKVVKRKPYFHFLVDISKNQATKVNAYSTLINSALKEYPELVENSKISYVNTFVNTNSLNSDWESSLKSQSFEGGFYLDRAIRSSLVKAYQKETETYPIFVVVSNQFENAILTKDFSDLQFTFPENNYFFKLDEQGSLLPHSLISNPEQELKQIKEECRFCYSALAYPMSNNSIVYLPNNLESSIVLKTNNFKLDETTMKSKDWESGLKIQGQWMSQIIHPENSDKEWLSLVRSSFKSSILTPVTSYLVVENEAQKAMLKTKQEQALSGKSSLDLGEDTQRMSEPSWWILMFLFGGIIWYKDRDRKESLPNYN